MFHMCHLDECQFTIDVMVSRDAIRVWRGCYLRAALESGGMILREEDAKAVAMCAGCFRRVYDAASADGGSETRTALEKLFTASSSESYVSNAVDSLAIARRS